MNNFGDKAWAIIPVMGQCIEDILSVMPLYNAKISKSLGVHPVQNNRGGGQYLTWTLINDDSALGNKTSSGALGYKTVKNILVDEDYHNENVYGYESEVYQNSWKTFQKGIQDMGELCKEYISNNPSLSYTAQICRAMNMHLCPDSAQGEFIDYIIKVLMSQGILAYTGEKGPRNSKLIKVLSSRKYEFQPMLDQSRYRKGISAGEALAASALDSILIDGIYHQYKWSGCKDKKQLPFDFFDSVNDIVFEIDGAQHFTPVEYFGGERSFYYTRSHDIIKNRFVCEEGLTLVRIDSTTRNVRDCIKNVYKNLDNLTDVFVRG